MATGIYSFLHMLVDGICALAMFGRFAEQPEGDWAWYLLLYNFCAFALQMPFGILLDLLSQRGKRKEWQRNLDLPFLYAVLGVLLTLLGAVSHPVVLGTGNALFHIGGGVGTIREDFSHHWGGKALGIFVAPGAFGLYVGAQAAGQMGNHLPVLFLTVGGVMAVLLLILGYSLFRGAGSSQSAAPHAIRQEKRFGAEESVILLGCFFVVILRSYVGMAVTFPWKTTMFLGVISVLAVVAGKMLGGIFAAQLGRKSTVFVSLTLSAVCFWFCNYTVFGIAALLLFNMTMPVTLYLLIERFRGLPGFCFGFLTFGLFLGFLPVYFQMALPAAEPVVGAGLSAVSLVVLLAVVCLAEKKGKGCWGFSC